MSGFSTGAGPGMPRSAERETGLRKRRQKRSTVDYEQVFEREVKEVMNGRKPTVLREIQDNQMSWTDDRSPDFFTGKKATVTRTSQNQRTPNEEGEEASLYVDKDSAIMCTEMDDLACMQVQRLLSEKCTLSAEKNELASRVEDLNEQVEYLRLENQELASTLSREREGSKSLTSSSTSSRSAGSSAQSWTSLDPVKTLQFICDSRFVSVLTRNDTIRRNLFEGRSSARKEREYYLPNMALNMGCIVLLGISIFGAAACTRKPRKFNT